MDIKSVESKGTGELSNPAMPVSGRLEHAEFLLSSSLHIPEKHSFIAPDLIQR